MKLFYLLASEKESSRLLMTVSCWLKETLSVLTCPRLLTNSAQRLTLNESLRSSMKARKLLIVVEIHGTSSK